MPLGEVDPEPVRARPSRHGRQALVAAMGGVRYSHRALPHDTQQLDKLLHLLRQTFQHHTKGTAIDETLMTLTSGVSSIPFGEMAGNVYRGQSAEAPFATVLSIARNNLLLQCIMNTEPSPLNSRRGGGGGGTEYLAQ